MQTNSFPTLYDHWLNKVDGYTNFGSFQTSILHSYTLAGNTNREKLASIYPEWFTEQIKIPKTETEKVVSFNETLTALTVEVCTNPHRYWFVYDRIEGGYKGVIAELISWATEFEKYFEYETWEEQDWYDAIDTWVEESLEELGYEL